MVRKNIVAAGLVGLVPALLTLSLEQIGSLTLNPITDALAAGGMVFLLPGMVVSMVVSDNAHVFPLWLAAIVNFVFYFLVSWGVAGLIGKALVRLKVSRGATNS